MSVGRLAGRAPLRGARGARRGVNPARPWAQGINGARERGGAGRRTAFRELDLSSAC